MAQYFLMAMFASFVVFDAFFSASLSQRVEEAKPRHSYALPTDRSRSSVDWDPDEVLMEADPRYLANCKIARNDDCSSEVFRGVRVYGMYPAVVMLVNDWPTLSFYNRDVCSGTLISDRVVLTAGHCIDNGVDRYVVTGDGITRGAVVETDHEKRPFADIKSKTAAGDVVTRVSFLRIVQSERMTSSKAFNTQLDIGLVQLEEPVPGIANVKFADSLQIDSAAMLRAVGYGLTETHQLGLKHHTDVVVGSSSCSGSVRSGKGTVKDPNWYGCLNKHELVAGRLIPFAAIKKGPSADTCMGDSGGPLLVEERDESGQRRYVIAAVTSRAVSRIGLNDGSISCGDGGVYVRSDGITRQWIAYIVEKKWMLGSPN